MAELLCGNSNLMRLGCRVPAFLLRCGALFAQELEALAFGPFDPGAPLGLLRSTALPAFRAPATTLADEGREVILAIVDRDLLARFDAPPRHVLNTAVSLDRLRVRPAGVVDVTRHVPASGAVDGPAAVDLEHVARAASLETVRLLVADPPTAVGDDVGALPDIPGRKQT